MLKWPDAHLRYFNARRRDSSVKYNIMTYNTHTQHRHASDFRSFCRLFLSYAYAVSQCIVLYWVVHICVKRNFISI